MKTILLINNGSAGLYGFRRELIEALVQRYNVVLMARANGSVDKLEAMGCRFIHMDMDSHGTNPLKELELVSRYKKAISSVAPDVVLTFTIKPNIYAGRACASLKIPYIANITGLGTAVENGGLMQRITVPLYRWGLRKAGMVFFQNAENRDFMLKRRMVSGAYSLLPGSGVNLNAFPLQAYPDGETVDFTYISRIMREKGIDQYLDAAKEIRSRHPETRFHVYGSANAEYKDSMRRLNEDGTIVFHGYTEQVLDVHKQSACTIHPSCYPEGMSNVLLESCACGRPIITTDRAGCREIVDEGVNGYVVRQYDSRDLIEKIERFLSLSWEQRRDMGLAGREKVEREFDRQIVVHRYLEEIERVGL